MIKVNTTSESIWNERAHFSLFDKNDMEYESEWWMAGYQSHTFSRDHFRCSWFYGDHSFPNFGRMIDWF